MAICQYCDKEYKPECKVLDAVTCLECFHRVESAHLYWINHRELAQSAIDALTALHNNITCDPIQAEDKPALLDAIKLAKDQYDFSVDMINSLLEELRA